jgi:fumarylacetoacetate (FAA) hydrolase
VKLASLPQGRDGRLIVVSDDLAWYAEADHIVPTMQKLLDEWERHAPLLESLAVELAHGAIPRLRFHEREAAAPLPRAYQWVDGSAYPNHVALVREARGATTAQPAPGEPLMYQGGSDDMRSARSPITLEDEAWGCDLEAEVCVVTGDVPRRATPEQALASVRLVGLANDVSLRRLALGELEKGFGFIQAKPATAFSPVLVTPDSLGEAWHGGRLHLTMMIDRNGEPLGRVEAGEDCAFGFGELIAHLARTRRVGAGSIIGSGTVSNRDPDGSPGRPVADGGRGFSCLLDQRTVEKATQGKPNSSWLRWGDTVRIEMRDRRGKSVFGAIEQQVIQA